MSDLIYICGSDTAGTPKVWFWDGSSLTDLAFVPGSGTFARCMYYYAAGRTLYVGTDDAKIHAYDGAWSYDVAQVLDARDVATIERYDDGVNGEMWWVLQGDRPNHLAGVGGISLWYGSSLTSLTKVAGLHPWMARGLCMMQAAPFLVVITHADGRAWINSGGGVAKVDATVGGNWTNAGFTNAASPQHSCFMAYADIGGHGPRYYYMKSTGLDYAYYKTVITGGATNLGAGAAGWIPHPIYGPRCFYEYLNRLYIMDRRYDRVGYLTGALNYPMDADLNGGAVVNNADGAPAAFVEFNGALHVIYRNAFNTKSFIQRRVADTNWNKDLELDPGDFLDAVTGPRLDGSDKTRIRYIERTVDGLITTPPGFGDGIV